MEMQLENGFIEMNEEEIQLVGGGERSLAGLGKAIIGGGVAGTGAGGGAGTIVVPGVGAVPGAIAGGVIGAVGGAIGYLIFGK